MPNNTDFQADDIPAIKSILHSILQQHPVGLSEYELLCELKTAEFPVFHSTSSSLELFQAHFVLMHCLYALDTELTSTQATRIYISPLNIQLCTASDGTETAIDEFDWARDYYLDLRQLDATDEHAVDELIEQFWVHFSGFGDRETALAALGLSDPVDEATIKRRYRELVSQYHPDRGESHETLQDINKAYRVLKRK